MIFLALSGKMIFLFPENMILLLGQKMKDDLSQKKQKKHENMIFYSNVLKRWSFQRDRAGTLSFLYYLERQYFFFPQMWCFFFGQKMKDNLSQEIRGGTKFLYIPTSATNLTSRPPAKKNQRWSYPAKIHLKVTEILDLHSKKSSNNSLYFYGDLYRRFHTLLSSEKTRKLSR